MKALLLLLLFNFSYAEDSDYVQPFSFFHLPKTRNTLFEQQQAALAAQITPEPPLLKAKLPDVSEQLGTAVYSGIYYDFYKSSDETIMALQRALAQGNRLDPSVVDMGVDESGLLLFGNPADGRFNPMRQWVRRLLVYSPLCVLPTLVKPHNDLKFHDSIVHVLALMRQEGFEFEQQTNMLLNTLQLSMEISKRPEYYRSILDSLTWEEFRSLNYKKLNEAVVNTRRGRWARDFATSHRERYQALLQEEALLRMDFTVFSHVRREMNCSVIF